MIEKLLPLTQNKLKIYATIYEAGGTHLLEVAKRLGLHPFSVQKTVSSLKFLERKKSGRTICLKIDEQSKELIELLSVIEDYRLSTTEKGVKQIINIVRNIFSKDKNILTCCLFGSFARGGFTQKSDIDLLFVVRLQDERILKSCRDISGVMGREISPMILKEKEFLTALKIREPAMETILVPSQRYVLIGKEYFLKNTRR